jgi:enoyl-CoA hydratase/carnithine racemase
MDPAEVLVSIAGPVATVTLNRPESGNSMTTEMLALLVETMVKLQQDPAVRVIVLTGKGKYFCTGMDVRKGVNISKMRPTAPFDAVFKSTKPVVGVLNGPAMGGGVGLFCCCDVRVCTSEAFVSLPEVAVGIYPALISAYVIPTFGASRSQYMMLTGARIPAAELLAAGIAHAVAPTGDLPTATERVVKSLLRNSLEAQAGVKRLIQLVAYGGEDHDDVKGLLAGEFRAMMTSADRKHAAKVFAETKRPPNWDEYYRTRAASKL